MRPPLNDRTFRLPPPMLAATFFAILALSRRTFCQSTTARDALGAGFFAAGAALLPATAAAMITFLGLLVARRVGGPVRELLAHDERAAVQRHGQHRAAARLDDHHARGLRRAGAQGVLQLGQAHHLDPPQLAPRRQGATLVRETTFVWKRPTPATDSPASQRSSTAAALSARLIREKAPSCWPVFRRLWSR